MSFSAYAGFLLQMNDQPKKSNHSKIREFLSRFYFNKHELNISIKFIAC